MNFMSTGFICQPVDIHFYKGDKKDPRGDSWKILAHSGSIL